MSKLTKREYRNIAKRPSTRGPGMAIRRSRPEEEIVDLIDEAEQDLTELGEGEAEVEESREDAGKVFEAPRSFGGA